MKWVTKVERRTLDSRLWSAFTIPDAVERPTYRSLNVSLIQNKRERVDDVTIRLLAARILLTRINELVRGGRFRFTVLSLPGDTVRFLLILFLPALVAAAEIPPFPTGFHLFRLPLGELQSYVSGIYEGQLILAESAGIPQALCVDDGMTRAELTRTVLNALSYLSEKELLLPARTVVFRVLMEKVPCPGSERKPGR